MRKQDIYRPINCNYYDILEANAVRGNVCQIMYSDETGKVVQVQSKITNLYTKQKEEFMVMEHDLTIRLDQLISVDDQKVPSVDSPESSACTIF